MSRSLRLGLTLSLLALAGCRGPAASLSLTGVAPPARPQPAGAVPAAQAVGQAPTTPSVLPDRVLVGLRPNISPERFMALSALAGYRLLDSLKMGSRYLLKLDLPDGMTPEAARTALSPLAEVDRTAEDVVARPAAYSFTNPDTRLGAQWAHEAAHGNTINAWETIKTVDQSKIVVAVLDTGCDTGHPELAPRIVAPRNFTVYPDTADVSDEEGHGTHVTGIIGATGNNGVGVAGVAWGVKLLPIKVLGGDGSSFTVLQGIDYAINYAPNDGSRVRVINMSLGIPSAAVSAFFTQYVELARQAGIVVVVAAGNDSRGSAASPANTPGVLSVGSTGHYLDWEMLSPFSNYGDRIDLVAPGESIWSTAPRFGSQLQANYDAISGTSMAAPYVAGVAALVAAKYDGANAKRNAAFAELVRTRLIKAVDDLGAPGKDLLYGNGRLNAQKAVAPATLEEAP